MERQKLADKQILFSLRKEIVSASSADGPCGPIPSLASLVDGIARADGCSLDVALADGEERKAEEAFHRALPKPSYEFEQRRMCLSMGGAKIAKTTRFPFKRTAELRGTVDFDVRHVDIDLE